MTHSETANRASIFIVGAPKSSTTALADALRQHPGIHSLKKEVHHFGSDLNFFRPRPDAARYAELCAEAAPGQRILDASVFYLFSKKAAEEIKAYNPDAHIIIMLRHPVEMMHSMHAQTLSNVDEDVTDFEQALAAEPDRAAGKRIPKAAHSQHALLYRALVDFPDQIRRYFDVFGKDRVKVLLIDDYRADARGCFDDIVAWLDLPPFAPDLRVVNPATSARFPLLRKIEKIIAPGDESRMKRAIPKPIRKLIGPLKHRLMVKKADKMPLDPNLRLALTKEFEPMVQELEALIGRDLSHWTTATGEPARKSA